MAVHTYLVHWCGPVQVQHIHFCPAPYQVEDNVCPGTGSSQMERGSSVCVCVCACVCVTEREREREGEGEGERERQREGERERERGRKTEREGDRERERETTDNCWATGSSQCDGSLVDIRTWGGKYLAPKGKKVLPLHLVRCIDISFLQVLRQVLHPCEVPFPHRFMKLRKILQP